MICPWLNVSLWLAPLGLLWFALVRQLSAEWSLNAQYSYGWAVPVLCLVLFYRDFHTKALASNFTEAAKDHLNGRIVLLGVAALAAYPVTRLVQEANPDWRLVSWMMAVEVVGFTIVLLKLILPIGFPLFSVGFFLTGVPWPTLVEAPVINQLGRMIAIATVEIIGCFGIPAVLRGNVIEIGSGTLGIDPACSGIRSFQVSLMLALFFGHWYRLRLYLRLMCLTAALVLAVFLNLMRTTLLATIAATIGLNQAAGYHELVGIVIPLGCFLGIWSLTRLLREHPPVPVGPKAGAGEIGTTAKVIVFFNTCKPLSLIPVLLLLWIGAAEMSVRTWYRLKESTLPEPVVWHIEAPRGQSRFCAEPVSGSARQILRFDQGLNMTWVDQNQWRWQVIFLSWNSGGPAARLPRNHTPVDCLAAAGYDLTEQPGWRIFSVQGLEFPFRCYVTKTGEAIVRVFYCLWEDRASHRCFDASWLTYRERLEAVIAGRRNSGQRSLELAVWGASTQQDAEAALQLLLNQIVRVDP